MHSIVGPFPEVEAAYRSERISASFRDHAASPHRYLFQRHRHTTRTNGNVSSQRPLRAA